MKKLFITTGVFFFFFIVLIIFFIPNFEKNSEKVLSVKEKELNPQSTYMVKEYQGNIAIFEKDNKKPFKITNISLLELPEADQELLQIGIIASSQTELTQIIEDYCS